MFPNYQKPLASGESGQHYIKIKVLGWDSREVFFRIKMNMPLGRIKKTYADLVHAPEGTLKFLFDGERIEDHATAEKLGLIDDDVIEVYQTQTGGQF